MKLPALVSGTALKSRGFGQSLREAFSRWRDARGEDREAVGLSILSNIAGMLTVRNIETFYKDGRLEDLASTLLDVGAKLTKGQVNIPRDLLDHARPLVESMVTAGMVSSADAVMVEANKGLDKMGPDTLARTMGTLTRRAQGLEV